MRIIFLDIDGVLKPGNTDFANEHKPWERFDPYSCLLIEKLCLHTSAKLVVSSNWRTEFTIEAMAKILGRLGFLLYKDDWRTDSLGPKRGHEIDRWLTDRAGIDNYLVIDDLTKDHFLFHQQTNLITTLNEAGFKDEHFKPSIDILMGRG